MKTNKKYSQGFTLLELLIVIAILAILSAALVLVLNPAESMKKSRDTQRMSDLATLKTALGLYMTTVTSPSLGTANFCLTSTNPAAKIGYSANPGTCSGTAPVAGTDATNTFAAAYCLGGGAVVDGTGWIPVNLTAITGGSPISNLPVDPVNTLTVDNPVGTDLVYRYTCQEAANTGKPSYVFEINAVLESDQYKPSGTDDKPSKDGGDNPNMYEVGTNLKLLGAGADF